ncbi:hypothetical protein [Alloyangia pacifica]|uniref:hypothetical protein n=1 Tax=Alloyangia pacifica TaxID=311180 RepID=UPI001CFCC406|nr:hypothetical protein [Alloyangia pacifica]
MNKSRNIIPFRGRVSVQHQAREIDLAAALERARPAVMAACEPVKGLRAARRAQVLKELFAPTSRTAT